MSFLFGVLAGAACLVIGGYGLYKVAFAQGYVEGYEDGEHKDEVVFVPED